MAEEMEIVALTGREVKSVCYDWVINNLSFFTEERNIESPTFTAGDRFKWKLEIVPKWNRNGQFWRLGVLSMSDESVTCKVSAVLVDHEGCVIKEMTSLPWDTAKGEIKWKTNRWNSAYHHQLFMFDDDHLTVKVQIKYSPKSTACTTEIQRPIPPGMWNQLKKLL